MENVVLRLGRNWSHHRAQDTDSNVDEGKHLDDAAAEEEEEEDEESDQDEYSSDDDIGVENVDSDDNADNVSKDDGSLGVPPLERRRYNSC